MGGVEVFPAFTTVQSIADLLEETKATIANWMRDCGMPAPRSRGRPYSMADIDNLIVYAIATRGFRVFGRIYREEIASPAIEFAESAELATPNHAEAFNIWLQHYYSGRNHSLTIREVTHIWLTSTPELSLVQVRACQLFCKEKYEEIIKEYKNENPTNPKQPENPR